MALLKKMDYIHGLTVEYWMIGKVVEDKVANQSHATIYPYTDKAEREANINDYVAELAIMVAGIPGYNLTYADIYAYIHTTDSWLSDALDV